MKHRLVFTNQSTADPSAESQLSFANLYVGLAGIARISPSSKQVLVPVWQATPF